MLVQGPKSKMADCQTQYQQYTYMFIPASINITGLVHLKSEISIVGEKSSSTVSEPHWRCESSHRPNYDSLNYT